MAYLPFTDRLNMSSGAGFKYEVYSVKFNGYEHRAKAGINNVKETWSLTWIPLGPADTTTLVTFLNDTAGVLPFDLESPIDGLTKKFVVDGDLTIRMEDGVNATVSCNIRQVFDI